MQDPANPSRTASFSQVGFGRLIGESAPMRGSTGFIRKITIVC